MMDTSFDTIIIGTGFASSYFLYEYLKLAKSNEKILVIEKGEDLPYAWKLDTKLNSRISFDSQINNITPQKPWIQNIAFGGGSCWTGNTPRMHPSDFKMHSLHGVGEDWPFDYSTLEPYLVEVETHMGISGEASSHYPRSAPYPMQPHNLNAFDRLIKNKYGDLHIAMPSARANDFSYGRAKCCNNGVCSVCPVGAKFQVDLHMRSLFEDKRVTLKLDTSVEQITIQNNIARGVECREGGQLVHYKGNFVAIGAHAVMSPFILLNSGIEQYALGRYLSEQISVDVRVNLENVENFDGGQRVTGLGAMFVNEGDRDKVPSCLVENYNVPWLRAEFGKWRHTGLLKFVLEDIPEPDKRVTAGVNGKPNIEYAQHSDYMIRGINNINTRVERLLDGLPVEDFKIEQKEHGNLGGSAHIQGTMRMGNDPETSVVDKNLINHKIRNLACLGSGAFPTCPAANPTLILSALSIKSARAIFS